MRFVRAAVVAAPLGFAALAAAWPSPARAQTAAEKAAAPQMLAAADRRNWAEARTIAARSPLLTKLEAWIEYTTPGNKASFDEISAFLRDNPSWPSQALLRSNAEAAMTPDISDNTVLNWFAGGPPRTTQGRMRLILALENRGRQEEAVAYIRKTWIESNFGVEQEKDFLKLHGGQLRKQDYLDRVDRLLWDGRGWEAERILKYVDKGHQLAAQARIQLRGMGSGAEAALRKVPKELLNDPGVIYERLRWRRRKELDVEARQLLVNPPKDLGGHADAWWSERAILARRALRTGEASVAYDLVGRTSQATGTALAESEWLAGWISLRFLNNPARAYTHFVRLHDNVRYPVSQSRGAYWAGRAAEAKGDKALAAEWYKKAAMHVTSFYGQLAAVNLRDDVATLLPRDPTPTAELRKSFNERELVRAARLLVQASDRRWLRGFMLALVDQLKAPEEQELVAEMAVDMGRPDLAVSAAKSAVRGGVQLVSTGYPLKGLPTGDAGGVERELLLGLMRQESAFDMQAVSPSGARGLMQIMPSTAKGLAKQTGLPYEQDRLTSDPSYNVALGSHYLGDLINDFNGSYVMAVAAYNAGPGRVRAWIKAYGDPRAGALDIIDWIELIPFDETRDYVQRVLENTQIYRTRLAQGKPVTLTLKDDLDRPRRGAMR
ncbi:MAG TPA: lytic transglycosylase domain-containing protein [Alphaproteobacteria bacterium]|jgi:soluble lytic murein transglycosylase